MFDVFDTIFDIIDFIEDLVDVIQLFSKSFGKLLDGIAKIKKKIEKRKKQKKSNV